MIVDEVFYADAAPWPIDLDGTGLALHRSNTLASGNDPSAWREGLPSPTSATIALADTDGDGITDQWEFDHSGSITGVVASAQTGDGDGFSYLDEYLLDFNPGVSNAPFSIQGIGADPSVQIIFGATSAQRSYTIEYSTNLISGFGWKLLQTGVPGSDGTTLFSDPATNAVRYYRVRVP